MSVANTTPLRELKLRALILLFAALSGCSTHNQIAGPLESSDATLTGSGITLYAAGDIADCRGTQADATMAARTAERIATGLAADPTAVALTLGDNVYQSGTAEEHANCYAPTWGRFKARTFPSPGNHEYYSAGAAGYYDYFGALAGPDRRGYYSVELGSWHVISLNSNLKDSAQQAQLDWLKTDLAAHHAGCTLAYWHHPVFSSGGHGNNSQMRAAWQLLADAGADVVLSGHDHDYERFSLQDASGKADPQHGMRQFVVGTGGAELSPFVIVRANSLVRNNATYGVLQLTLMTDGYAWQYLPVAGGTLQDNGSKRCHRAA